MSKRVDMMLNPEFYVHQDDPKVISPGLNIPIIHKEDLEGLLEMTMKGKLSGPAYGALVNLYDRCKAMGLVQ